MSHLVHKSLLQSLFDLLSNDSVISSSVEKVCAKSEEGEEYPYILIDTLTSRDWSTRTTLGFITEIPILVYHRDGMQQTIDVLDRIYELLIEGNITLLDHQLVALRFDTHDVVVEEDGVTYRGTIRFRAYSEFIPV